LNLAQVYARKVILFKTFLHRNVFTAKWPYAIMIDADIFKTFFFQISRSF